MDKTYLSQGNEKTGDSWSFDIPARSTCPGKTEFCASRCYAAKLSAAYPNVGRKYERNLEFANSVEFVRYMIQNIPHGSTGRLHVSGDFFSVEYVEKWKEIARKRPDVQLYVYTRSWRIDELWFAIMELNALSNVNVNLSVDKDTGMPEVPYADDYRWCYLSSDDKAPEWMRREDIVFRTNHNARQGNHQWKRKKAIAKGQNPDEVAPILHRIAGAVVCPFERGRDMPASFSCSQCGLCIKKPQAVKVNA